MKRHLVIAVGAALAALSSSAASFAQETTVVAQPAPVTTTVEPAGETRAYTGPNRALIGSGLITFGLSYIPAVVVAGTSDQSTDHHLYVPIVGPWLDLADRPGCGPGSVSCDGETTNKVLLAVDGVFQGIGALTVVAGFLSPERDVVTTTTAADKPTVHVSPTRVGYGGYGLAAFGNF